MAPVLGCIGLGVMGGPICAHLVRKSGSRVVGFDRLAANLEPLAPQGLEPVASIAAIGRAAEVAFLSLPGGPEVAEVAAGLLPSMAAGATVVDLGTTPVDLTHELAATFGDHGVGWIDAPVARTRFAAERGELSTMVGADDAGFARVEPYLRCFASDVLHCGPVGTGQVVKLMNNMVLFEVASAVAEALAIGRRSGVAPATLLDALAQGSGDSFALRNHGMKAMLPGAYPDRAFSTRYALKDLDYALALATAAAVDAKGARLVRERFTQAIDAGDGDRYWPVIARHIDPDPS